MLKQKKYYPIDPGLRYAIISQTGQDPGKNLEILVYLKLRQNYDQVCYWQEPHKGEIDFVAVKGRSLSLLFKSFGMHHTLVINWH